LLAVSLAGCDPIPVKSRVKTPQRSMARRDMIPSGSRTGKGVGRRGAPSGCRPGKKWARIFPASATMLVDYAPATEVAHCHISEVVRDHIGLPRPASAAQNGATSGK
jgi:hypothetical protein